MAKVFYDGFLRPQVSEPEIQRVPERVKLASSEILGEEVSVFVLTEDRMLSIECSKEMELMVRGFNFDAFRFLPASKETSELILSEIEDYLTRELGFGTTQEGKRHT